jgi:hypothetical protein
MDYMTGSKSGFFRRTHRDMFEVQNNKQVNLFDIMQKELAKEAVRHRFRGLENQFSITPNIIRSYQIYFPSISTVPIHQNVDFGKITDSGGHHDDPNAIFGFAAEICHTCWHISVELFYFGQQSEKGNERNNLGHVCHRTELHNVPRYARNNRILEPKEVQKALLPLFLREHIVSRWATSSIYVLAYKVSDPSSQEFTLMDLRNPRRKLKINSAKVKLVELDLKTEDLCNWASRAITNSFTVMNRNELDDFLQKIENASFALFKVYSESLVEFYFMALSIIPIQIVF